MPKKEADTSALRLAITKRFRLLPYILGGVDVFTTKYQHLIFGGPLGLVQIIFIPGMLLGMLGSPFASRAHVMIIVFFQNRVDATFAIPPMVSF